MTVTPESKLAPRDENENGKVCSMKPSDPKASQKAVLVNDGFRGINTFLEGRWIPINDGFRGINTFLEGRWIPRGTKDFFL